MRNFTTLLMAVVAFATNLGAGPVTNWHTFKAASATTLSGQGTSSPVFGSPSATASAGFLIGYFDPIALTNVGDRITFSYQVTFTDPVHITNAQDNFRFALFDLNGQTPVAAENTAAAGVDGQTDDWRGYWFGVRHPSGVGSIRERIAALVTGDNPFAATGMNGPTAPSLGGVGGDGVNFLSSPDPAGGPAYVGVMALERTSTGVTLAGYFGGNGATNRFVANDDSAPWPANYGAVGYLNGGPLLCDQVNFQNVMVDYAPSNALQITSQPTNVTVVQGQPAQFSVSWSGSGLIPYVQWRENGFDIPGETNATYTIPATDISQNGYAYSVVISNIFGDSATSSDAILTVIPDTTAPVVLSASSLVSNSLNVIFSERVDAGTASDFNSYFLSGNTINSVTLIGGTNALVVFENPITTANYTLTVENVYDTAGNQMAATNVQGIAHGWQESLSIGISDGLAFAFNDKPVVFAGGADIFGASDQFQFVYKAIAGDFDLAVRVESLLNTHENAKAGLMARVNPFFDSRNVMIEATPGRFIFQYRTNTSDSTFALTSPRPPTAFPNSWVRLVRSGSVLTGYSSTAPGSWDLIGSHDTATAAEGSYPAEILIGLAVTSHNANAVTRAQFSGFGRVIARPSLTIARMGADVEVSWPLASLGFTLQATPNLSSPITWTNVPGSSATNRVIVPATDNLFFRATVE